MRDDGIWETRKRLPSLAGRYRDKVLRSTDDAERLRRILIERYGRAAYEAAEKAIEEKA